MPLDLQVVGPWVLLGVGVVLLLSGALSALRTKEFAARKLLLLLVFGLASSGVGVFGLRFLSTYSEFLRVVLDYSKAATPENAEKLLTAMATTDVPKEYLQVARNMIMAQPPAEFDKRLDRTIKAAPTGRNTPFLKEMRSEFDKQVDVAIRVGTQPASAPDREHLLKPVRNASDDLLRGKHLDPRTIRRLREP
jgi:hypothetical protein